MTTYNYYTFSDDDNHDIETDDPNPPFDPLPEIFFVDTATLTTDRNINLLHNSNTPAGAKRHIQCSTTHNFRLKINDKLFGSSTLTLLTTMVSGQVSSFVYDKDDSQWKLWNGSHRPLQFGQTAIKGSNGLTPVQLELSRGRNMDGTPFGATPGTGTFGVSLSYPTSPAYYLFGQAAGGHSTTTTEAYWEYMVPQNYYGRLDFDSTDTHSGDLTLTVIASYKKDGGPNVGLAYVQVDAVQANANNTFGRSLVDTPFKQGPIVGSCTATQTSMTVAVGTSNIVTGDYVSGPGLAHYTKVTSFSGTTVTLDKQVTSSEPNKEYYFYRGPIAPIYPDDPDFLGTDFAIDGSPLNPGVRLMLFITVVVENTIGAGTVTPHASFVQLR